MRQLVVEAVARLIQVYYESSRIWQFSEGQPFCKYLKSHWVDSWGLLVWYSANSACYEFVIQETLRSCISVDTVKARNIMLKKVLFLTNCSYYEVDWNCKNHCSAKMISTYVGVNCDWDMFDLEYIHIIFYGLNRLSFDYYQSSCSFVIFWVLNFTGITDISLYQVYMCMPWLVIVLSFFQTYSYIVYFLDMRISFLSCF